MGVGWNKRGCSRPLRKKTSERGSFDEWQSSGLKLLDIASETVS